MSAGSFSCASATPCAGELARLSTALVRPGDVDAALLAKLGQPLSRESHALELLRRPELGYDDLTSAAPSTARRGRTGSAMSGSPSR